MAHHDGFKVSDADSGQDVAGPLLGWVVGGSVAPEDRVTLEVHETAEAITLVMGLVGFDLNALQVTVDRTALTVRAPDLNDASTGVQRTVVLGGVVDALGIRARLKGAMLTVTMPKLPPLQRVVTVERQ
jgi:HSP20 family molecular chaperone IbpA